MESLPVETLQMIAEWVVMDHDRNHCSPKYQQLLSNLRLVSRKLNGCTKSVQERVLYLPIATIARGRLRFNHRAEEKIEEVLFEEDRQRHIREVHVVLRGFGDESETSMADRRDSLNDLDPAEDNWVYRGGRPAIDFSDDRDPLRSLPLGFVPLVAHLPALRTIRYISRILNDRTQQPVYDLAIGLFWEVVHARLMRPSVYELLDVRFKGAYNKRFIHVTSSWFCGDAEIYEGMSRRPLRMTQEFITWGLDYREQDVHDTVVGMHFFTRLLQRSGPANVPGQRRGMVRFRDPSGQAGVPKKVTLAIENYNLWLAVLQEHFFFFGEMTTEVSLRGVSLNDAAWGQMLCFFLVGIQSEEEESSYKFLDGVDGDDDGDDDGDGDNNDNDNGNDNNSDNDSSDSGSETASHHQPVGTGRTEYFLMKDCSYSNYFHPEELSVMARLDSDPNVDADPDPDPVPDPSTQLQANPQASLRARPQLQGKYAERQRLYRSLADKCISWQGSEAFAGPDRRWMAMLFARVQENRVRKGLPLLDLKRMYGLEKWSGLEGSGSGAGSWSGGMS